MSELNRGQEPGALFVLSQVPARSRMAFVPSLPTSAAVPEATLTPVPEAQTTVMVPEPLLRTSLKRPSVGDSARVRVGVPVMVRAPRAGRAYRRANVLG